MGRGPTSKGEREKPGGDFQKQAARGEEENELEPLFLDIAARFRAVLREDAKKTDLKKLAAGRRAMIRRLLRDSNPRAYVENQETAKEPEPWEMRP